ncbi:zinc finger protein [Fragilaria crotonensis]|nr:zinc finger protein [Fragilaria crotonensis]
MAALLPQGDDWKKGDESDMSEIRGCLCMNCQSSDGVTVMLPTKVPLFREIIVMSFYCENCSFRNTEVNFGGELQERGETLTLHVSCPEDLNRQVIKSDSATLAIPQLDFEIPPGTQRGTISTLEGVLKRAAENLELLQPERLRLGDVDNFHRCRKVIKALLVYAGEEQDEDDDEEDRIVQFPFEVILDDIAGNSYIENPHAPAVDPNLTSRKYTRTPNQDMALGLQPSKEAREEGIIDDANPRHKNVANAAPTHRIEIHRAADDPDSVKQEVMKFSTDCPHCYRQAETDMCLTDIPHFKEIIIMSLVCEYCGYRSNEIKGGGAIPKFGTKIMLRVQCVDDLQREVLKSDTAGLTIPEIDMELDEGGLDGLYTTVEGLLKKVYERLKEANPFGTGDSAKKQHLTNDGGEFSKPSATYVRYMEFLDRLKALLEGQTFPFTIVISDPLSNSFVGPVPRDAIQLALQAEREGSNDCYNNYVDQGMDVQEYERSHDQNEILGLNDMRTENYQSQVEDRINFGTDAQEELPDRIRRLDIRGPDHPHNVGKAPVEGDDTIMGPGSVNHAVPAMAQRGKMKPVEQAAPGPSLSVSDLLFKFEKHDDNFRMSETFGGSIEGMVFKFGAQGIGYYSDIGMKNLADYFQHLK